MADQVLVNIIRCFDDRRNRLLERLWDTYAELHKDEMRLLVHANPGGRIRHSKMLGKIWDDVMLRSNRYVLITEYDFLPKPNFLPLDKLDSNYPVLASMYVTRDPGTRRLKKHEELIGAWYILVDREHIDYLDLSDGGPFNDPANLLAKFLHERGVGARILLPADCYPKHYGVEYATGTHLFFSRHYADPPNMRVAGFALRDIHRGVDRAVREWYRSQPEEFHELYEIRNAPCDTAPAEA